MPQGGKTVPSGVKLLQGCYNMPTAGSQLGTLVAKPQAAEAEHRQLPHWHPRPQWVALVGGLMAGVGSKAVTPGAAALLRA